MISSSVFKRHPTGLFTFTFAEFWGRFNYYGIQTLLVLYLTKNFSFSANLSYSAYGVYTTFAFIMPLVGGLLADRWFGLFNTVIVGTSFVLAGNVLLFIGGLKVTYFGLALIILGIGLYKTAYTSLVGEIYPASDSRRQAGFTWFYMGMNLGAIFGPIIYGLLAYNIAWRYAFLSSAVGVLSGFILFLLRKKTIYNTTRLKKRYNENFPVVALKLNYICLYAALFATVFTVFIIFSYPFLLNIFIIIFFTIVLIVLFLFVKRYSFEQRRRILGLLCLTFFATFFFSSTLQLASSVILFIHDHINRTFFGFTIPAQLFGSLEPLSVVIMMPALTYLWLKLRAVNCDPAEPYKIFIGISLASLGFFIFTLSALASQHGQQHWALVLIVIANLVIGTGELALMPAMLAAISRYAPLDFKGTMMGVWFLSSAFAGYIGSWLAKISVYHDKYMHAKNLPVSNFIYGFFAVAVIICLLALLLLAVAQPIKKLLY